MEIAGLPLHALVVHAAVVLIPLAALAAVALVVLPTWRWLLRWPAAVLSVAVVGLAYLATTSGESLEHSRPQLEQLVHEHAERGDRLATLTVVLAVVVLAAALVLPGDSALLSGRGARLSRSRVLEAVVAVVVVLVAVLVLVQVVLTGDSGARAVWG